jgi:hypothetical protein
MPGSRRKVVTGGGRNLHFQKLRKYSLPKVITVIKSRRRRWAWHVAHKGQMKNI